MRQPLLQIYLLHSITVWKVEGGGLMALQSWFGHVIWAFYYIRETSPLCIRPLEVGFVQGAQARSVTASTTWRHSALWSATQSIWLVPPVVVQCTAYTAVCGVSGPNHTFLKHAPPSVAMVPPYRQGIGGGGEGRAINMKCKINFKEKV